VSATGHPGSELHALIWPHLESSGWKYHTESKRGFVYELGFGRRFSQVLLGNDESDSDDDREWYRNELAAYADARPFHPVAFELRPMKSTTTFRLRHSAVRLEAKQNEGTKQVVLADLVPGELRSIAEIDRRFELNQSSAVAAWWPVWAEIEHLRFAGAKDLAPLTSAAEEFISLRNLPHDMVGRPGSWMWQSSAAEPVDDEFALRKLFENRVIAGALADSRQVSEGLDTLGFVIAVTTANEAAQHSLSRSPEVAIRAALARNPSLNGTLLSQLSTDASESVQLALACNPACSGEMLRPLASGGTKAVKLALLRGPNCDDQLLKQLTEDRSKVVRKAAVERLALVTLNDPMSRLADPDLAEEELRELAAHSQAAVRAAAAQHPRCPDAALRALLSDRAQEPRIEAMVALLRSSPALPARGSKDRAAFFSRLGETVDIGVMVNIISQLRDDGEIERLVSNDRKRLPVITAAAKVGGPRTLKFIAVWAEVWSDELVDLFVNAAAPDVRAAVVRRLPAERQAALATDESNKVRRELARHLKSDAAAAILAADTDDDVRQELLFGRNQFPNALRIIRDTSPIEWERELAQDQLSTQPSDQTTSD